MKVLWKDIGSWLQLTFYGILGSILSIHRMEQGFDFSYCLYAKPQHYFPTLLKGSRHSIWGKRAL